MATILGIAITNLTSKAGILSRKASIRLATEVGEKVLQRKGELGRNLNAEEIEQVFAEVLPKKCRPKIITTEAEVRECLKRDGLNEEQINAQISGCKKNYMAAAIVFNGIRKYPIYMPTEGEAWIPSALKPYLDAMAPATVAHETEHALEKNCRIFDIFKRQTSGIKKFFGKLFDKNYMENLSNREVAIHNFEGEMQKKLQPIADVDAAKSGIVKMNCEPTVESISEQLGGEGKLVENLRQIMRENYASGLNKGSEQNKRFKLMSYWMDMERPAYEVTGKMEEKIYGLKEGENGINTGIAKGYEAARKIAKQERRTYWINKILGRLKKPNVYVTDKDILRHATSKEEKEILTKMIANMEEEQKISLIRFLSANQGQKSPIKSLHQFLEATKIDGKPLYTNLEYLEGISPEILTNPDFIKIAKLSDASFSGTAAYKWALKDIAQCTPEQIREFAKIADTKEIVVPKIAKVSVKRSTQLKKFLGISENTTITNAIKASEETPIEYSYRYNLLASYISNPHFNELKAFADINVDGKYPYACLVEGIARLPSERIKTNLELAQKAAKEGKSIFDDICQEIDSIV